MMILATSKSVCEVNSQHQYGSEDDEMAIKMENKRGEGRHARPNHELHHSISVSILDSIPNMFVFGKSNESRDGIDDDASYSNHTLSTRSSPASSVVSFSDFFAHSLLSRSSSMVISKSSSNADDEQSQDNNLAQLVLDNELKTAATMPPKKPPDNKQQSRRKKKPKWRNVSQELALFKCKRAAENALYFVNNFNDIEIDSDDDSTNDNTRHIHNYTASGVARLIELNERLESPNIYAKEASGTTNRAEKTRLKKLIKTNDVKSLVSRNEQRPIRHFTFDDLRKGTTIVHIKYNVYKRIVGQLLEIYVPVMQRLRYSNAPNRVDARHKIEPTFLAENKKFFKSIRALDLTISNSNKSNSNASNQHDSHVVTSHSINSGHRTVFDDPEYLEFLIQLQHREITPEDYDYLTRLDERIKKKTTDEQILKRLRTETISSETTSDRDAESCCGICLDGYLVGHTVKYLPCGHRFHADCIDNWLKNQSVNCPLDNLPIDASSSSWSSSSSSNQSSTHKRDVSTPLQTVLEDLNETFISGSDNHDFCYFDDDISILFSDDSYGNSDMDEESREDTLMVMNKLLLDVEDRVVLHDVLDELLSKISAADF